MDDLSLEHAFLKAPCELLAKSFRARQKLVHKELQAVTAAAAALPPSPSPQALAALSARVSSLRTALEDSAADEERATARCSARLAHLHGRPRVAPREAAALSSVPAPQAPWDKTRLDRMLVDYMFRRGVDGAAAALAEAEHIGDLVEFDVFAASRAVAADLRARSCAVALRWCAENKRRLSRIGSELHFRLRLQEFVELVRRGAKCEAIRYVREDTVANAVRIADEQRAMALLAFAPDTDCAPYKDLYADARWDELIDMFEQDNYRLHGLPSESMLETTLKAGLSTLKTVQCGNPSTANPSCPTCVEPYRSLSQPLPRARHVHSVLVCGISKKIMDENNPPMVLPNGNVYGNDALARISAARNGTVLDPKTNEEFPMSQLRRAFIM